LRAHLGLKHVFFVLVHDEDFDVGVLFSDGAYGFEAFETATEDSQGVGLLQLGLQQLGVGDVS